MEWALQPDSSTKQLLEVMLRPMLDSRSMEVHSLTCSRSSSSRSRIKALLGAGLAKDGANSNSNNRSVAHQTGAPSKEGVGRQVAALSVGLEAAPLPGKDETVQAPVVEAANQGSKGAIEQTWEVTATSAPTFCALTQDSTGEIRELMGLLRQHDTALSTARCKRVSVLFLSNLSVQKNETDVCCGQCVALPHICRRTGSSSVKKNETKAAHFQGKTSRT